MSTKPNTLLPQLSMFGANKDVSFAVGMALVLAVLFLPLPPILLDFGLALSLSLSVLIFMVALWIPSPLQFNSFPTLLLVTTMLRLSLNVASTRLILSEGHAGMHAAGDVIQGFSKFIVAGNFVIGVVIFAILVIINFVVITKGSTRIAEVAARFSLDAMPGKQMAIDADMGAGLIDEDEARRRRKELEDESAFFGAMDGASKFVRGDAVAGLIITLINVIGGILIGVVQRGMGVGDAFNVFTSLTIGDGLVSQIPALVVSLAAGLIVTKGGTRGAANEAVFDQLSNFPKALYMAALLLFGIGLLPGFPLLVFALLAAAMVGLGLMIQRGAAEAAEAKAKADAEAQKQQDMPEVDNNPMHLDELRLVLGEGLVALANRPDAVLPSKIKSLRKHFAEEFGFPMPSVRIKDDVSLPINSYAFQIHGVDAAKGDIRANQMMVINPEGAPLQLPGEATREPTFGLDALWVDSKVADQAEAQGYTVVDPESVITTHLTEVVKENMSELLTYGAAKEAIEGLDRNYQKLVNDLPVPSPAILVQQVLQELLLERVSIRNLPLIVEAMAEATRQTSKPALVLENVRRRLSSQICQGLADGQGFVPVITLSPSWEAEFIEAVKIVGEDRTFVMSPKRVQEFVLQARQQIQRFASEDSWPALMVNPEARSYVRSMLERVSPMTPVISNAEIHRKVSLRTVATIGG
ncbi:MULTISPECIES: flagellar biosynthesis protein FlhA [Sulfitobacter]|uniref:flagellar biosynthesis protein FlhA n=1 Tax=Sulfitobacter TaxID=60136 RepID=UPI00230783CA|nr:MULTISPECIES: flagellar biosynthesis protein FlhA [Sulfitobacter]MDF3383230.1 flagellar biosynthesis protein FlhA [Sulfitobacter sp. Ks11]MDF3386649.1 flagellar biosynthesis protein FlhA [Sulfitobacter sp. M85]MDF3390068.1 flagellar biosynthesis protein FlhA [Sulfitobacter sp. Ks16]MDF3400705.1 flagellar biosynthesis protein FlhA [Sulfitobacter sp. KE39]MDF3404126.1 flagellar biosynthesis protein FlhA [Sulfitobacter sp. Ks35]